MAQVLVDPPHIVQKLTKSFVASLGELEFDNNELSTRINRQQIDPTAIDREFHASATARFDSIKNPRQEIPKV